MEHFFRSLMANKRLITMVVLCVMTAGVGGWYLLRGEAPAETPVPSLPVQTEVSAPVPEIPAEPMEEPDPPAVETVQEIPLVIEEDPLPIPVLDDTPVVAQPPKLVVSPLNGTVLTVFAVDELVYNETFEDWRTHDGIDIAATAGTTVLAASSGTVLSVEQDDMMGTTVVIDHGDGYQTTYANLQSQPTVEAGESVTAGQIIGAVGTTAAAESAQGPHLHFSVSKNGDAVDPNVYLEK